MKFWYAYHRGLQGPCMDAWGGKARTNRRIFQFSHAVREEFSRLFAYSTIQACFGFFPPERVPVEKARRSQRVHVQLG